MDDLDEQILNYVNITEESQLSAAGFAKYLGQNSLSAKAAELALKGFTLAANMAVMALAGFVVSKAIEWWDNYTHRVEKAREALDGSVSDFKNVQEEIKNLEEKLSDVEGKIKKIFQQQENNIIEKIHIELYALAAYKNKTHLRFLIHSD